MGMVIVSWLDCDWHRMWDCQETEHLDVEVNKNDDRNKDEEQSSNSEMKVIMNVRVWTQQEQGY